ncbi:glutamate--cysteine ligase regulatory subunit-like [Convolutriloba macropyga]|uniref:glutamate--cysteine ligase regulatory subunit-like n=1 Tax=Convolutriloba macropyga TaxID=536237 RepID=UPI003F51BF71
MTSATLFADIDPRGCDDVLPAIPNASSLFIHTGNIINRGFIYKRSPTVTEEIKLTCVKTLGKWLSGINKHETKMLDVVDMDYGQITNSAGITEDRKNLKITVKLFVNNAGPDCVNEALNCVGAKLGTSYVETLILSLPGTSHGASVTYNGLVGPYWEAAESVSHFEYTSRTHHSECSKRSNPDDTLGSGEVGEEEDEDELMCSEDSASVVRKDANDGNVFISWTVGFSDLNAASLRDVYDNAHNKPSIDQINSDVCCSPPEDLVALCKEKDIQLLTHNDPRDILSEDVMAEILSSHLTHHKDLLGWQVAWVLRYSGLVKCRGIIHTKGYIVKLARNSSSQDHFMIAPH